MKPRDLEKLRRLGLTQQTSAGLEGVRVSAQWRQPPEGQPAARRQKALETWTRNVAAKLARHGGEVIPDSMSVSGLTVEAIVPIDAFEDAEAAVADENARLDVVMPRQVLG